MYDYNEKNRLRSRIAGMVGQLMTEKSIYQEELDKEETVAYLAEVMSGLTWDEFDKMPDDSLRQRLRKLMSLHMAAGMLNDLSRDQIRIFDEAVTGI
jgi:hypothetical protein